MLQVSVNLWAWDIPIKVRFWKRNSVYILGAGVTYVGAFGFYFIGGDTDPRARIVWSLVSGTLTWPFFLVPQVFIQWAVRKLIGHRLDNAFSRQLLVVNCPILILVAGLLAGQYLATRPEKRFGKMITKPIPASVGAIQQGGFRAMDGLFWVLRFHISNSDLDRLLEDLHFAPTSVVENLWFWNRRIRSNAKMDVDITEAWQAYISKEQRAKKYIFFNTNNSEVVFVLDTH